MYSLAFQIRSSTDVIWLIKKLILKHGVYIPTSHGIFLGNYISKCLDTNEILLKQEAQSLDCTVNSVWKVSVNSLKSLIDPGSLWKPFMSQNFQLFKNYAVISTFYR